MSRVLRVGPLAASEGWLMLAEVLDPTNYLASVHSLGPWIAGLLTAALGIAVLLRERGSKLSQALALLTTSLAVWLLCIGALYSTRHQGLGLWWVKVEHLGVVFIPTAVFILTLTIVQRVQAFRVLVWGSLAVSAGFYLSILSTERFISGLYRYNWGDYPRYGPLGLPFLAFFFCLLAWSLVLLRAELARSSPCIHRQRIKSLLAAFGVAYLGAIDYLGAYGMPVYPIGYVPILGFVVLMVRAVWRYRLLEVTPALAAEQIISGIADALLVVDREGTVRVANAAASLLFGYSPAELIGRPVAATLGDLFGQHLIDAVTAAGLVREHEIQYRSRDGKTLILDITGCVTRDGAGRPIAFVFIGRDITEHKRLEEQLYESRKLEALGHLAGDIARELQTNFSVISRQGMLLLSGLEHSAGAPGMRAVVDEMKEAVHRAAELTGQLLAFSSTQGFKPTLLDLNALVANLRGVLRWVLGTDMRLRTELDPALGWVNADPAQTEQVIITLAANARNAMAPGQRFTLETANVRVPPFPPHPHGIVRPGKYAMLAMGASGWVIDEDARNHVFEPSLARKKQGRVTGMELACVYGIVKQCGGYIDVDSGPERGTTFRIYFPLIGPASGVASTERARPRFARSLGDPGPRSHHAHHPAWGAARSLS
jgi:PAS domain S-box-containing protein